MVQFRRCSVKETWNSDLRKSCRQGKLVSLDLVAAGEGILKLRATPTEDQKVK